MKGLIAFLLILIVAALGYMIWDKEMTKSHLLAEAQAAERDRQDIEDQERLRRHRIEEAILAGQVLKGMNRYEVYKAWGRDYELSPDDIDAEDRKKGAYEAWRFSDDSKGVLYMSVDGKVLAVARYKKE